MSQDRLVGMIGPMSPWMTGGIAVHVDSLSAALRSRYRIRVVTPCRASGSPAEHRPVPNETREVRPVQIHVRAEWLSEASGGLRYLRGVDLLHLHDSRVASVAHFLGKPLVTTFHGYLPMEALANGASPRVLRFYQAIVSRAVRESRAVIAVDDRIGRWLATDYGAENLHVIPNGVDTETFAPAPPTRSDGPVLLCAKGFTPKNGLEFAIRALPEVLRESPQTTLSMAGFGPLEGHVRELAAALGVTANVRFLGPVSHDRMPGLLNGADAVLVPSVPVAGVEEATSILALEAMSCARPVVASDIGGLHQIIKTGVTGILVPPADPHALARAVISLLRDDEGRAGVGARAREYVLTHHTWAKAAEDTSRVYEGVLGA